MRPHTPYADGRVITYEGLHSEMQKVCWARGVDAGKAKSAPSPMPVPGWQQEILDSAEGPPDIAKAVHVP